MAQMIFEDFLEENAHLANDFIENFFKGTDNADIQKYLYKPLSDFSSNAGKRHRPLICMAACQAVGGNFEDALICGCAIENFHSAALIHDDIADNSELRRGQPCMYLTEGLGLAINVGDMALSSVVSCVLSDKKLSDSVKVRVLHELCVMDERTIEGQALDIGWTRDHRFDISIDEYLTMATLKTAYYSGGVPLAVGAIIGGGSEEQIKALHEYGILTGLAFQIQDDLLNITGESDIVGKDMYSDIIEGKRTFAVIYAIENSKHALELEAIIDKETNTQEEIRRALEILNECGSLEAARRYSVELAKKGKSILDPVLEESAAKTLLLDMADYFIERLK